MTTSTPDYAGAYHDVRVGLIDLLRSRNDPELDTIAPATPEWRVRDVAAHLAGVCDDITQGNMTGVATDEWTAAQVAKRADWTMEQLVTDWDEHAIVVEGQMNTWGPGMGQMVFDAFTHEQDIRGAFDEPGGRESAAAAISFDWIVTSLQAPADASPDDPRLLPPIHVVTDAGEADIFGAPGAATTLRVSRFEFLRTITGRRSRRQIEALNWDGAPRVDDLCVNDLFRPSLVDIVE
jgi:uncharacterized protein (TIGR03083 family)